MKYLSALLIICCISLSAQTGNSLEISQKGKSKYPLQSGKITYKITGDGVGTATLFFDRSGWREVLIREVTFNKYGTTSTEKTMTLVDGDQVYIINLGTKKGTKNQNNKWSELSAYKDAKEIDEILNEENTGSILEEQQILNYPVKVWSFSKGSLRSKWSWQGITLREEKSLGKLKYTMEATSVDENSNIAEEVFKIPSDIKFIDPN